MKKLAMNEKYFTHIHWTVVNVSKELNSGLKLLNKINSPIITFLGSHNVDEKDPLYKHCEDMAFKLGKQGYGIVTGGGPGIMMAANSGASKANAVSIGFKAKLLLKEQGVAQNIYTQKLSFRFLFARRFALAVKSDALIFYPGGYGTLNEFFEYVTLIQTKMADPVPIICVNKKFWQGMFKWLEESVLPKKYISSSHLDMVHFAESYEDVIKILKKKK